MGTKGVMFRLDEEVISLMRRMVKRPQTYSNFVQEAIVKSLKAYRKPLDFVIEKKGESFEIGKLDREDGVPWLNQEDWSEKGWRDYWAMNSSMRAVIDSMRVEANRPELLDDEWEAIVEYMGKEPGWKRPKELETKRNQNSPWGTSENP